jgi:glycerol kinase
LPVLRRADLESTSRGVALLAGVQAGVLPDLSSWSGLVDEPAPQRFSPRIDGPSRQRWRARWRSAVERSLHWHAQTASVGAAEST